MELIIAILFFALASTVCIQLFARSHLLSKQTVNQNHAVIQAQNLAEMFLAADGDVKQMKALFPDNYSDTQDESFVILLDSDWEKCDKSQVHNIALLTAYPSGNGLVEAKISVFAAESDGKPFYELTIVHHIAERRGNFEQD